MIRFIQSIVIVLAVGIAPASTLADLQSSFMARYDEANDKRDQQLETLTNGYLGALERRMEKLQASGDLDQVLSVRDEIKAVKAGSDPLPALPDTAPYEFKQLRKKYLDARSEIRTEHAEAVVGLADKMSAALEAREADLTKAGEIDEALNARRMRETLAGDAGISRARDILRFSRAGDRPAYRIRRSGDDLEALVFRDSSAQVSMKSRIEIIDPPERFEEFSEPKLGNFVGAEDFEVMPHVSFHQRYDKRADGSEIRAMGIRIEPGAEVDGRVGLRMIRSRNAKNPRLSIAEVLPTEHPPHQVRITAAFYLPGENRVVSRMLFPSVGELTGEKAKWHTKTATGSWDGKRSSLIFYIAGPAGTSAEETEGDGLVLGELKVEILTFPAYLVERYDKQGRVSERFDDPASQPVLVSGGEIQ